MASMKVAVAAWTPCVPTSNVPSTQVSLDALQLVCIAQTPWKRAPVTCAAPVRPCILTGHADTVRSVALLKATLALVYLDSSLYICAPTGLLAEASKALGTFLPCCENEDVVSFLVLLGEPCLDSPVTAELASGGGSAWAASRLS